MTKDGFIGMSPCANTCRRGEHRDMRSRLRCSRRIQTLMACLIYVDSLLPTNLEP